MKTATAPLPPLRSVKVLDQLRERIRYLHYSLPTEQAYVHWFVPSSVSTVCVTRQPLGSEVEAFVLAGERAQGFGLHASSGIGGLAVLLRQGAVHGSALASGDRKTRPSRRLPVVLTPDEVVRNPRFSGKASIVCSPSFCMERACGSVRVCNCGSRIWI